MKWPMNSGEVGVCRYRALEGYYNDCVAAILAIKRSLSSLAGL
jgi:hypothetical protein